MAAALRSSFVRRGGRFWSRFSVSFLVVILVFYVIKLGSFPTFISASEIGIDEASKEADNRCGVRVQLIEEKTSKEA